MSFIEVHKHVYGVKIADVRVGVGNGHSAEVTNHALINGVTRARIEYFIASLHSNGQELPDNRLTARLNAHIFQRVGHFSYVHKKRKLDQFRQFMLTYRTYMGIKCF